jgi:hypothetical protein
MNEIDTNPDLEDGTLAVELTSAFGRLIDQYERHFKLSRPEALAQAREGGPENLQRLLEIPPTELSWIDLHQIAQTDPALSRSRWEEVKQAALDELRSGHRTAQAVETTGFGAWPRAQFLAIREDLAAEWQPRNGIERQLIDAMALAQTSSLTWMHQLTTYTLLQSTYSEKSEREEGKWQAPRQRDADAMQQAAEMVDRFNRIFLRTLRALRDLRRYGPTVIVKKGGQLNVAEQQVNLNSAG